MKTAGCGSVKFSYDPETLHLERAACRGHYNPRTADTHTRARTHAHTHAHTRARAHTHTHTQGSSDRLRMLTWPAAIFGCEFGLKPCSAIDSHPPAFFASHYSPYVERPCPNSPTKCLNKCFGRPSESK